jgi:hypothetical protein
MLGRFYFMLIFATHHNSEIFTVPPPLWFGDALGTNLKDLLTRLPHFVPLALRALQGTGQTPWGAISAGSAIAVLPLLMIFVFASRRLIEGLTAGTVKT